MRATLALCLLACFINLIQSESLAPRGPRPVNQGYRHSSKLCSEKEWPTCTDDEWGTKCPSGCRMQGLIETKNQQNDDWVRQIRQMLENYSKTFGNTHISVTEAVNRIRQTLKELGNFGGSYYQLVDHLNSRLTILQNRINKQIYKLKLLQRSILEQFTEISRLEVDIDIKIRACKGSCAKSFIYNIDRERNAQMEKNLRSMTSIKVESIQYGRTTHIFKMATEKKVPLDSKFKSLEINNEYPHIWQESYNIFTLAPSTKNPSEAHNVFSNNNGVTAISSSVRNETTDASGVGSRSKDYDSAGYSRQHQMGSSHAGETDFTRTSGREHSHHSSHSQTHFSSGSVTTKTTISGDGKITKVTTSGSPSLSLEALFDKLRMPLHSTKNISTSSMTKTSTHHFPNFESHPSSGTKSVGSKTGSSVFHTKTSTTIGDLTDFSNLGEYSDFDNLNLRDPDVRTDEASSSSKTVINDRTQHWSSNSNSKGIKSIPEMHVVRLNDDETGDTDPSARMFEREEQ